jgi:N-acetylglucosamine-6-phosphate deacetylase
VTGRVRLTGGTVLTPSGVVSADVLIEAGRIVEIVDDVDDRFDDVDERFERSTDETAFERIEVEDRLVVPGFIDLQLNGGYGIDLTSEPDRIGELASLLPRHGVTAFLPTIVTSTHDARRLALAEMASLRSSDVPVGAARPLGLHFEGPMLASSRRGAHAAQLLAPLDAVELSTWRADGGVAMVTLAPELPGALAAVEQLHAQGVVVACGHTDAGPEEFAAGRRAGISYVTHLFNAMRPFTHRDPGTVGAVLTDDAVVAGLICDGVHVDPIAVRLAWSVLGPDRLNLVTDAVAALGGPHGAVRLGRTAVTVGDTGVRTADGVLAGSNLALDTAVRNLVRFTGCDLHDALSTVTSTPARVLGRTDLGAVRPGAAADLVVLDDDGRVRLTIVGGAVAWRS